MAKRNTEDERMLTVAEVAGRVRVSERTVQRWIKGDRLRAHKLGRAVRISAADLAAFLAHGRDVAR